MVAIKIGIKGIMVIVAAIIAIILAIALVANTNFRLFVIGSALLILAIVYGVSNVGNSRIRAGITLILIAIGLVLILLPAFGLTQTFLGVSEFQTSDGKGFWLINGVADSIGDSAEFINTKPSTGILPDGTQVTPQRALRIDISRGEKQCEYVLLQRTALINFNWPAPNYDLTYYEVLPPDRVINAEFSDDRGNSQTIDGTLSQNFNFYDSDGQGKATITTVGSLQGKQDCADSSNLVIALQSENANTESTFFGLFESGLLFTNEVEYLDKDELLRFADDPEGVGTFGNNNVFIQSYSGGALNIEGNKLIATGRDIGVVQYAITADRDYFDSLVIDPAQPSDPRILEIVTPADFAAGETSSIKVNIINDGGSGQATLKLTGSNFDFGTSGTSFTINEGERKEITSLISVQNVADPAAMITAEVCGISQLGTGTCDSLSKQIAIVAASEDRVDSCGNGVCEDFESATSCSADCQGSGATTNLECSWYQEQSIISEKDYGPGYWRLYTPGVDPIVTTTPVCRTANWVIFSAIGVVFLGIIGLAISLMVPKKKGSKKRRRK